MQVCQLPATRYTKKATWSRLLGGLYCLWVVLVKQPLRLQLEQEVISLVDDLTDCDVQGVAHGYASTT